MAFNNSVNASNTDFELSSGTLQRNVLTFYHPDFAENIGIGLSAGTFSIQGANGSALSASNPGYVTLPSKTAGRMVKIPVTANQTFVDASGSSTITGNQFGWGTTDVSSFDVLFFIYAVINDAENAVSFMISRTGGMTLSPNSSNIGKTGSAIADNGFSFFALGNPTVTDYDNNPCKILGTFRMTLATGSAWTVSALNTRDGIGNFQDDVLWTMPPAILGAATNSHWQPNGGTAPAWTTASNYGYQYRSTKDGMCWLTYYIIGDPSTDGTGAVQAQLVIPFKLATTPNYCGSGRLTAGPSSQSILMSVITNGNNFCAPQFVNDTANGILPNSLLTAAFLGGLEISCYYPCLKA